MKGSMYLMMFVLLCSHRVSAQTNIHFTHPAIYNILKGNYLPDDYGASVKITDPAIISQAILDEIQPDSLRQTLFELRKFHTRNTGSDTLSAGRGMGAARNWVLKKFNEYSAQHENRLIAGFLQFDQDICAMQRHKNVVAVLPGQNIDDPSSIIIEAHLDSRCADVCDTACLAEGMEDNGSGVAHVLELARVMSQFTFDHTLVFMAVTGEEQNLAGSSAFAMYAQQEQIPFKAVFNNDIVGGIICGETSSDPSCPGLNHIDSTQVRLFSFGGFNSPHKSLVRFIKLQYEEMIKPFAAVPMRVSLMTSEDRIGRGSDHIPFRSAGYTAIRFTSANEHGNADVSDPEYHDRQHTSEDILGLDTDGDAVIDSFFVDFNYLGRNASINGNAAAMAALGPESPAILNVSQDGDYVYIDLEDPYDYNQYVIGYRVNGVDFDSLYYLNGSKSGYFELPKRDVNIFISAAAIDSNGIESFFSAEELVRLTGVKDEPDLRKTIELLQNKPNPFDESTMISFIVPSAAAVTEAKIVVTDLSGKPVKELPVIVQDGMNEVIFHHGYNMTGAYLYTLIVNGQVIATKKMVFAN